MIESRHDPHHVPDCESCVGTAGNADHLLLKCPSQKSSRDLSNLAVFADVREAILTEPSQVVQFLHAIGRTALSPCQDFILVISKWIGHGGQTI